ncbi:MAG: PQQ-binding-like beta-propeller repeat protein, partial [Gammaproteobacteria bacterium]|nr:PQQ-binding-like beta-propeller repeat protein [Gammaproteobacteria bacterium]
MTTTMRSICIVAAALALSACGLFGNDDEKELEPTKLTDIKTTLQIKKLWSTKVGADSEFLRIALRPIGDGNRIYAASRDGNVVALNPESGTEFWRRKLDIELSSGPGVGEGLVVVGAADGDLIALSADSG